jgi:diguanylate cyclase (GGDEF)-like protein
MRRHPVPICTDVAAGRVSGGRATGRAALARDFRARLRQETRSTTLIAGGVAAVAWPVWAIYDQIVVPEKATQFLAVRIAAEVLLLLGSLALWHPRVGGRWPEQVSVALVLVPEIAIAWMIPRTGPAMTGYLLGLSLAIYATSYLLMWRWQLTVVLVLTTGVALAGFSLAAEPGLDAADVATIVFYLVTASALAIAAQVYRERKSWQQHVTSSDLEAERHRNELLVAELDQLTREDPLTSLGNRRAWEERVTGEFLRARRSGQPLSLVVCDFDHFKMVNDHHGHSMGDAVLRIGAAVISSRVRPSDFVARLGGDEFAILCPDTPLEGAVELGNAVCAETRQASFPPGIEMTCSVGIAELCPEDTTTEDLYHRADCALYEAKVARDTLRWARPGASRTPS